MSGLPINDVQVSTNHALFSVFNAGILYMMWVFYFVGHLCVIPVFYEAVGSSICNRGLLYS